MNWDKILFIITSRENSLFKGYVNIAVNFVQLILKRTEKSNLNIKQYIKICSCIKLRKTSLPSHVHFRISDRHNHF